MGRHSDDGSFEPVARLGEIPPTQVRHPWRTIARTVVQVGAGAVAAVPVFVTSSGIPQTGAAIGLLLAVSAAVTRFMADPRVNGGIAVLAPWLAAEPRGADVRE
ncbi:hypothetical protein BJY24_004137 [Nocardia transvalensis]|uniref:Holin n=1 Tax=Nocardia transvalensis TaxID=37333 RepID=A0A7W9UK23_9NOCA|nr:hypothetical protein [Nocardia transvalensis]MBB5915270.1 hypothetical protein [Nocardia transvalensis]